MTEPTELELEKASVSKVNVHDSGPTEADEMDILNSLFFYDSTTGVFGNSKYGDE